MIRQLLFISILISPCAKAFESVTFITAQDRFTVIKNAHHYSVDGKVVHSDLLKQLEPLLTGPADDECPKLHERPLISAKVTTAGKTEFREFFIQHGVVRVGQHCLFATGVGLNFLPMRRSWLIGPFVETVRLKSPLTITGADGKVIANLVEKDGQWEDTRPVTDLDWDFFQRWQQSLSDYRVQYRVLALAGKGKPSVTVRSGRDKYVFYKLAPKLWAIQRGSEKWLDASGDWEFWFDMDSSVWIDHRAPLIHKVESAGVTLQQKQAAMQELEGDGWSRALEDFYQRRLLDNNEDLQIRLNSLERLKSKPSWRNIRVEMQALENNPNDELLKQLTIALRTRNVRGLTFEPGGSTDRARVVQSWSAWWQKNKNRKD